MNQVFWLGAGASAGSGVSNWPRKPPTIKHFFETERQFHPLSSSLDRAQGLLHRYIREVLFGSGAVPDHPRGGCPLHAAIAEHLEPSDAVISFNYDLIMDKALVDTDRWNEWAGYAPMVFNKIYDVGHWHPTMPTRDHFRCPSELTYLKLHGSINWFRSTGMRSVSESAERERMELDPEHPQRRVFSLFSSHAASRELMDSESFLEGQRMEQFLIPPTMHKNFALFQPLWIRAEEAPAGAKQLVIIGFSFAPADVQAEWLLRRGLARNVNAVPVTLVDPDDQVKQRIKANIAAFNGRHSVQNDEYRSLRDFVSTAYDQKPRVKLGSLT